MTASPIYYLAKLFVPPRVFQHAVHGLADVHSVIPVMVLDSLVAVVLLDGEQPPAEGVIVYIKAREESEVGEHSDDALKLKDD